MRRATRPTMADRYPYANISYIALRNSVADPDPYVFGPPGSGSGSISQRHGSGSGSFYHQAKKVVRKTLIPTVLLLLFDFSLKNYVNVPSKSNIQINNFLY
jgi:hypothetical protein